MCKYFKPIEFLRNSLTSVSFSRLNLLVFIMKLVLYLYARFLLSVLYTVLVIPRDL